MLHFFRSFCCSAICMGIKHGDGRLVPRKLECGDACKSSSTLRRVLKYRASPDCLRNKTIKCTLPKHSFDSTLYSLNRSVILASFVQFFNKKIDRVLPDYVDTGCQLQH